MSSRTVLWIVAILVVLAGIWYFWSTHNSASMVMTTPASDTSSATSDTNSTGQGSLSNGNSDQELNSDLTQIDTQTQTANTDSASVDQSFNDQPIQQAQ
jgi:FlaG/FlaF family flagellin (archaellin)